MMSVLAACNGGSSGSNSVSGGGTEDDGTPSSPTSYRIDASDSDVFTYLNFSNLDAPLGLSEVEAHNSFAWDIAFRRTRIILNGGDSGPGFITGALADAQDEFYDENEEPIVDVFINATPEINGEEAFNQDFETSTLTFIEDQIQPAIDDWYQLNTQTISFEADSEQHWIVRSGNGRSYAKFNIVDIENLVDLENSEFALNTLTATFDIQSRFANSFSGEVATKNITNIATGSICYSFENDENVDCETSDNWDLRFDSDYKIWLNSNIYGGGDGAVLFGALDQASVDSFSSADDTEEFQWIADSTAGVFVENSWYAYNLNRRHKLWPNYRVYILNKGDNYYKLQVRSYYNETGDSANYLVEFDQL